MSQLKGGKELRARIKALKLAFKPLGREWGNRTVQRYRTSVPVRSGKLRRSFRVRNATQRKAVVGGSFVAYFIDKGPKPHIIRPKSHGVLAFKVGGRPVFARQVHHRGYRGRPFRDRDAKLALRDVGVDALYDAWNRAA